MIRGVYVLQSHACLGLSGSVLPVCVRTQLFAGCLCDPLPLVYHRLNLGRDSRIARVFIIRYSPSLAPPLLAS